MRIAGWKQRAAMGLGAGLVLLSLGVGMAPRTEAAAEYLSYTLNWRHRKVAAPLGYVVERVLNGVGQLDQPMSQPQDLFLDKNENLWIADTDGNRIIEMTRDGQVLRTIKDDGDPTQPTPLFGPQGVFVAPNGEIFIADTGNKRIVHLDPNGKLLQIIGAPKSLLLGADFNFQPSKLVVDSNRMIYIVNGGDYRGLLQLDERGRFRSFFGANKVGFSWTRVLTRVVATEQQREQLTRVLPPPPSNITLDPAGFFYVPSQFAETSQIKKLNSVGKNSFPAQFYGEREVDGFTLVRPKFIDVAVDKNNIVSALDSATGRVYQYDQDGNPLLVFGGTGDQRGTFRFASSLVVDSRGWLYVLDSQRNDIQVFRPTEFAQLVHQASELYYNGDYERAAVYWQRVLDADTNYELGHKGLARNYYREQQYRRAMEEYRLAHDKAGYSMAFGELRKEWLRAHFGLAIVLVVGALVLAIVVGVLVNLYVKAGSRPGQIVGEA
ncbi:MAG: hypothetical protein IMX01_05555 [Limnochordaceae bacterium]|nr:hypothetical protein [Limnochordaceae bacterium]